MEINRKRFVIAIALTAIITAASLYFKTFRHELSTLEVLNESSVPGTDISQNKSASDNSPSTIYQDQGQKGLEAQGKILRKMIQANLSLEEVIKDLENSGLAPSIAEDKNDYTGDLVIVRLDNPLPGTRYFHGQFFKNGSGDANLQHVSFDYSGTNVADAANKVVQAMGHQGSPEVSREGYQLYRLNEDYIFWGKLLSQEDLIKLKSDPYKAYESGDVGKVIRFAVEQEIH